MILLLFSFRENENVDYFHEHPVFHGYIPNDHHGPILNDYVNIRDIVPITITIAPPNYRAMLLHSDVAVEPEVPSLDQSGGRRSRLGKADEYPHVSRCIGKYTSY